MSTLATGIFSPDSFVRTGGKVHSYMSSVRDIPCLVVTCGLDGGGTKSEGSDVFTLVI